MNTRSKNRNQIKFIAGVGVFTALAIVINFLTSFFKISGTFSLDAGDIAIVITSYIYGPVSGLVSSAIASLVGFIYSGTGPWGLLMDFASSGIFSVVASAIYWRKRNFRSAVIGIYVSVAVVSVAMMPLNVLVVPLYAGVSRMDVVYMIPTLLFPFNLVKALFNGSAVLILYKPIVRAMRKAGLAPLLTNSAGSDSATVGVASGHPTIHTKRALMIGGAVLLSAIVGLIILGSVHGCNISWD